MRVVIRALSIVLLSSCLVNLHLVAATPDIVKLYEKAMGDWDTEEEFDQMNAAKKYLIDHQSEAVDLLMLKLEESKNESYCYQLDKLIFAMNDPSIEEGIIALLENNMYEKDPEGNRKLYGYGSPWGCESSSHEFAIRLIRLLILRKGENVDRVIELATHEGGYGVPEFALEVLCLRGTMTFSELVQLATSEDSRAWEAKSAACEVLRSREMQESEDVLSNCDLYLSKCYPDDPKEWHKELNKSMIVDVLIVKVRALVKEDRLKEAKAIALQAKSLGCYKPNLDELLLLIDQK